MSRSLAWIRDRLHHALGGYWRASKSTPRSSTPRSIEELRARHRHVITVDPGCIPWSSQDPLRELRAWCSEHRCCLLMDRVLWCQWKKLWESNGIGGEDLAFIGIDCDEIATVAQLRWGSA
jgi:hypothetical protein